MTSKIQINRSEYSNLPLTEPRSESWSNYEETEHQSSGSSDNTSSIYYNPEWKNLIDHQGNLFFVKCHPFETQSGSSQPSDHLIFRNEFKRISLRRNKGILAKIGGKKLKKNLYDLKILNCHKYQHPDGILKEFLINIKPSKFGKLTKSLTHQSEENLFENIFNATVLLSPDGKRFLVDKIHENSIFSKETSIKIGDVLKSIDGELIVPENIHDLLKKVQNQKNLKLVLQEFYPDEISLSTEEMKLTKLEDLVENKEKLFNLGTEMPEMIFSLILMRKVIVPGSEDEDLQTVFCYPPKDSNLFHRIKGAFLTIDSILNSSFSTAPLVTSFGIQDKIFHLSYHSRNQGQELLFLGFNSHFSKLFDVKFHTKNFMEFMNYYYPNFSKNDNFQELQNFCDLFKIQLMKVSSSKIPQFESLFNLNVNVQLPKEIYLRINDSLSELEAMDYRNWNENVMELFGKFNVIGTCLFYKTFLICSHLNVQDQSNVELFLRNHCLKLLFSCCSIKEVVIWRRVFPKEYQSFNLENNSEINKVFLVIVAHGNLLMCVLLEENGYCGPAVQDTEDSQENAEEDKKESANYLIYYLEEIEDILDHLKIVGIENLTRIWINSQKRPQVKYLYDDSDFLPTVETETVSLKTIQEDQEEDSDWENMDSQKSSSGFDMTDLSDNIYKEFTDIIPQTLTFGPENVLFHYTQLDQGGEGVILTSINDFQQNPGKNDLVLDIFRRSCLKIHAILQSSIKYRQILSKENKINFQNQRSLIAVKEHGILVQIKNDNESVTEVWVVGRLFTIPQRELYVCYDAKIPQNLIEIAFRVCLNCVG